MFEFPRLTSSLKCPKCKFEHLQFHENRPNSIWSWRLWAVIKRSRTEYTWVILFQFYWAAQDLLRGVFFYCCIATMKDLSFSSITGRERTNCSRLSPQHLSGLKGLVGKWSVNKENVWQLHWWKSEQLLMRFSAAPLSQRHTIKTEYIMSVDNPVRSLDLQ